MQQHEKSCGMKSWKGRGQSLASGMGRHCTTHDHLFHRHNTNLQTTESTHYKATVMVLVDFMGIKRNATPPLRLQSDQRTMCNLIDCPKSLSPPFTSTHFSTSHLCSETSDDTASLCRLHKFRKLSHPLPLSYLLHPPLYPRSAATSGL